MPFDLRGKRNVMTEDEIHKLFSAQAPLPLFIYTITPDQVNTGAKTSNPVTLIVGVYNPKVNGFVKCSSIQLGISIGTGARELTGNYNAVKAESNQKEWEIQ